MKKSICFFVFLMAVSFMHAQVLKKPAGQPGQRTLPTPNIHVLGQADLSITNASLVSAVQTSKSWQIKIRVTVKNSGQQPAPATSIQAFAQKSDADNAWLALSAISFQ